MKFLDSDFATIQGKRVLYIGARLRVAREVYPKIALMSEVIFHSPDYAVVRVRAEAPDGPIGEGIGISVCTAEKPHMQRWWVSLAETRAQHRALRAVGIGTEFYGAEEIEDETAVRPEQIQPKNASNHNVKALIDRAVTDDNAKRVAGYRTKIANVIMAWAGGDRPTFTQMLGVVANGKVSSKDMSPDELRRVADVVTELDAKEFKGSKINVETLALAAAASRTGVVSAPRTAPDPF